MSTPGSEAALGLCFRRLGELVLNVSATLTSGVESFFSDCGTLVMAYFFGGRGVVHSGKQVLASDNCHIYRLTEPEVPWVRVLIVTSFHHILLLDEVVSGFDPQFSCVNRDEDGETASLLFPLFPEPRVIVNVKSKPVLSDFSLVSHSENLGSLDFSSFCSSDWWVCSLTVWSLVFLD